MAKTKFRKTGKKNRSKKSSQRQNTDEKKSSKRHKKDKWTEAQKTARLLAYIEALDSINDFDDFLAYNRSRTTGLSRDDLRLSSTISVGNDFVLAEINLDPNEGAIAMREEARQNKRLGQALARLP